MGGEAAAWQGATRAPGKADFFGENRNDNVMLMPLRAARRRFAEANDTVFYARARPSPTTSTGPATMAFV